MSAATVAAVLDRLAAWAEDRKQWTRRAYARDRSGHAVHPRDPRARRWCLVGRLQLVCGEDYRLIWHVRHAMWRADPESANLSLINDTGRLVAVRALIARAREEATCWSR